jgi:cobalt-zinc-cadmium efflux system membrane fusion protein
MKQLFTITLLLAAVAGLFSACEHADATAGKPVKEPLIGDSTMQLLTIDTARVRNIDDEVKLSGEVSFDENKVVKVYPFSSGQVLAVNVSIGDYVKAGQTLAVIKSADIAGTYADLSSAGNDVAIAKRSMENAESLYKNGISSEKEYIEAKENYNKAVSGANKIREQLRINGGGKTNADGTYVIAAPRSGYVVEKLINPGNFIRSDNNSNMFTIGDISDVWIWANVYETDVPKVKEGYTANVTAIAYPDSVFEGRVDKVNEVLDPVTKVMKVKIVLPNKAGLLKPEMFANVTISNTEKKTMISVPASALIKDNQKSFVVVFVDKENASIREVTVQKVVNGCAYIADGLQADEKVITQNQILIYKKLQDLSNSNAVTEK